LVCECGIKVKVGSGGYTHLETHKQGKEHAAAMKKKQTIRITSFFSRSILQPTLNAPQPSLLKNVAVQSKADLKDAKSDANISQGPSIPQAALVIHLCKLIMKLPESLPLGSLEDELASFATKPMWRSDKDENWEEIGDPILNRLLGMDIPDERIKNMIK
jgi:hypothetical protein